MDLVKKSKRLSYLLRHCQSPLYVALDGGWAPVDVILRELGLMRPQLNEIVATDIDFALAVDALYKNKLSAEELANYDEKTQRKMQVIKPTYRF